MSSGCPFKIIGQAGAEDALVHASCVALAQGAVLISGPSGAGKSTLALHLMSLGCRLVADDRVSLRPVEGGVQAQAPGHIAGIIEARGVGLLNVPDYQRRAPLALVVDLAQNEEDRLPPERTACVLGVTLPLLRRVEAPHFAPAILQFLKGGRNTTV
ncbi:MAG: HPr kinase/phosphorylase [Arenibacterium sp.]